MTMKRAILAAMTASSVWFSLSCDRVLGIPERSLDTRIACADGECVCLGDFANCDGDVDNGCETDVRSSSAHCGACGHDCLGGGCTEGRCEPVAVPTLEEDVTSFALIDGILYAFLDGQTPSFGFQRVDVREPMPVPLELQELQNSIHNARVRAGTGALILCDYTSIHSFSLETLTTTLLFESHDGHSQSCSVGGGMAWWTWYGHQLDTLGTTIYKVPENGVGGAVIVRKYMEPWSLTVFADDQGAYVEDPMTWTMMRYPYDGGSPVPMHNMPPNGGFVIASDAKNLYVNSEDESGYALFAIPRDGGAALRLAGISDSVTHAISDAQYVYLADYDRGTVLRVAIEGGKEDVVAAGQHIESENSVYVDERAVYWLAGDAVWRVAK
jgi:hypothetical protein